MYRDSREELYHHPRVDVYVAELFFFLLYNFCDLYFLVATSENKAMEMGPLLSQQGVD